MKIMDGNSWLKAFEPYYGPEYCQGVIMELEKLKDELYSGSNFRFQEGWLKPTLKLLQRLTSMGLHVRTEKYIFIHLVTPIETMGFGELYFQVGRKLPGRLSLKFTRKNPDGSIVIQPTVLQVEEEVQLATNPVGYMQQLMNSGRSVDQMLQQIVVLTDNYSRERVDVLPFLQQISLNAIADLQRRETSGIWQYHSSPAQQFAHMSNSNFNMSPVMTRTSIPHSTLMRNSSAIIGRTRSGSEGTLLTQGAGLNEKVIRGCRLSIHEPEENDETDSPCEPDVKSCQIPKIPGEAENYLSKGQKMVPEAERCSSPGKAGRKSQETSTAFKTTSARNDIRHRQSSFSTDEYTHTTQGLNQHGGMRSSSEGTGSQSSLRTDVKDEYAGVTEAMGSMHLSTVGNDPPSLNTKIEQWRLRNEKMHLAGLNSGMNEVPRMPVPDMALPNFTQSYSLNEGTLWNNRTGKPEMNQCQPQRYVIQEDYIGTVEGISGDIPQESWVSHRDSEPQAIFRQSQIDYRGIPYHGSVAPRSVLLPLSVEELNRECDQRSKYTFAEHR